MSSFTLETTRTITVREGWGVAVMPIWASADDREPPETIAEIEVFVVRIDREHCQQVGNAWCVQTDGSLYTPVENFQELDDLTSDDTHDLRTRWFATFIEAEAHATSVRQRWANPNPWESFVKLDGA